MRNPSHSTRSRTRLLTALLLTACALAAVGCSDDDPAAPGTVAPPGHTTSTTDGALELAIAADKASFGFGETIALTVTLTNVGGSPVDLDFSRGDPARFPNLGLNVYNDIGVYHFIDGRGEDDRTTLAPGAAISYSFDWNQNSWQTRRPVERGVYEVVGHVAFDNRDPLRAAGLFLELK